MIIDTHVHLDNQLFIDDVEDVILKATQNGVDSFIIPGANPHDLDRAVYLVEKFDNIYFSVGVHPYEIKTFDIGYLKRFITHPKCIAVGECGLDYFRLSGSYEEKDAIKSLQKKVFIEQILLAKEFNKPLIVHIREATFDSKSVLDEYASDLSGVLHCFNASAELLDLKGDFYYGIGGVLTFLNAKALIEIAPKIPIEKILFETDAPYLTPHPHRGKRNEPFYIRLVLDKLAAVLDIQKESLEIQVEQNTKRLFRV